MLVVRYHPPTPSYTKPQSEGQKQCNLAKSLSLSHVHQSPCQNQSREAAWPRQPPALDSFVNGEVARCPTQAQLPHHLCLAFLRSGQFQSETDSISLPQHSPFKILPRRSVILTSEWLCIARQLFSYSFVLEAQRFTVLVKEPDPTAKSLNVLSNIKMNFANDLYSK